MKLVLLPGMDGTGTLFKPILDMAPNDWEMIVVKYPSVGSQSYSKLQHFVETLLPVKDDYIIVAESFSGPVAYNIALKKLPCLKGIIFVATFLESPRPKLLMLFQKLFHITGGLRPPAFLLRKYFFEGSSQETIRLFWAAVNSTGKPILYDRLKTIHSLKPPSKTLDLPCAYIQPTNDALVPKKSIRLFEKNITSLRSYQVSGPHFILQANPVACIDVFETEKRLLTMG